MFVIVYNGNTNFTFSYKTICSDCDPFWTSASTGIIVSISLVIAAIIMIAIICFCFSKKPVKVAPSRHSNSLKDDDATVAVGSMKSTLALGGLMSETKLSKNLYGDMELLEYEGEPDEEKGKATTRMETTDNGTLDKTALIDHSLVDQDKLKGVSSGFVNYEDKGKSRSKREVLGAEK